MEINAVERRVNRQQTIRSIVKSAKGDGWNPKDVIQAIYIYIAFNAIVQRGCQEN